MKHPHASQPNTLKKEIGSRLSAVSNPKASLRILRAELQASFDAVVRKAKARGVAVTINVPELSFIAAKAEASLRLVAASARRWKRDPSMQVQAGSTRSLALLAGVSPDLQSKLILADALDKLLVMAGPLDAAAKQQIGRMLDSVELQLSLEIDRLEREADANPSHSPDLDRCIDLLDTIMRGNDQERIDAVVELYGNPKLLNLVTAAHLVRVLTSINDMVKQNP